VSTSQSWAVFGFGVHGGADGISADADNFPFVTNYTDPNSGTVFEFVGAILDRQETGTGGAFGGHFYVDFLPWFDLEVGIESAAAQFDVTFTPPPGIAAPPAVVEIGYARVNGYVALKKDLWEPPLPVLNWFKFYGGVAPTFGAFLPLAGEALSTEDIVDLMKDPEAEFDAEQFVTELEEDMVYGLGLQLLLGWRFKIPYLPPQIGMEARYHLVKDKTNDRGGSAFSLVARVGLDF
jgi:hypothetical protein